jgi:asparagine synthase (glutamine-hydrolysing)
LFGALFNFDGRPLALPSVALDLPKTTEIRVLGASRQAALLHVPSGEVGYPDEQCGLSSLEERYWIVGQIRLDRREELKLKLPAHVQHGSSTVSDARLCLHAYAKWGEQCVDHLAGDFSFVLWDEKDQRLFGARDQMGVRPLFFARGAASGFIGDSLDWVAGRETFGDVLDDYWIADFLTIGFCREFDRTVYRDVKRLPPAHVLRWSHGGAELRRYWRLEVSEPLYLPRRGDYTERFRELVGRAIADRMPKGRVGIAMSGGIDSTAMAACTVALTGDPGRVVAYCEHYEELMHIEEDKFASLAARHLGIELQIQRFDDAVYDPHWMSRATRLPEPMRMITSLHLIRGIYANLAAQSRVWFEGEGPDNALSLDRNAYLSWLVRRRAWGRLGKALIDYAMVKGLSGWRETLYRHLGRDGGPKEPPELAAWLNPDFVDRLHLAERIRDLGLGGDTSNPWHPIAVSILTFPLWQSFLAEYNVYESLGPMSWRHPYLDLRVLNFMVSVPPLPWAWKKQLVRESMRGRLPEPVLRRAKSPLPVDPQDIVLRRHGLPPLPARESLTAYLDPGRLPDVAARAPELSRTLDVHILGQWLESRREPWHSRTC